MLTRRPLTAAMTARTSRSLSMGGEAGQDRTGSGMGSGS
jgi:hypothetical protein